MAPWPDSTTTVNNNNSTSTCCPHCNRDPEDEEEFPEEPEPYIREMKQLSPVVAPTLASEPQPP